jgi:type II secretory pathway component GspD/PulD (secretin)
VWFQFLAHSLATATSRWLNRMPRTVCLTLLCCASSLPFLRSTVHAQVTFSDPSQLRLTSAPQQRSDNSSVEFNLDGEIKLGALLTYISKRLGVRFEYSPQIASRSVVLRAPGAVPVDALPSLLSSVLRTESLVLIDSDIAGWKRIVDVKDMAQFAPTGTAKEVLAQKGVAAPVTQVFMLKNVNVTTLTTALSPFLSENGGNVLGLSDSNVLIITDYAANIAAVEKLIKIIDQPRAAPGTRSLRSPKFTSETIGRAGLPGLEC